MHVNVVEVKGAKKSYGIYDTNTAKKLFVFGDSYVDTGNFVHSESYKPPNGMTFPGSPAGRFCDGRIITDYIGNTPFSFSLHNFKIKNNTKKWVSRAYLDLNQRNFSVDCMTCTLKFCTPDVLLSHLLFVAFVRWILSLRLPKCRKNITIKPNSAI